MTITVTTAGATKRTRRGLSKKKRAEKRATQEEMAIYEEEELQEKNRLGIVSVLEESVEVSTSNPLTTAAQTEAALAAIDKHENGDDDEMVLDTTAPAQLPLSTGEGATFKPLSALTQAATLRSEMRRIPIPPHRITPLKKDWVSIFVPLTEMAGLQVRMNVHRRCVEMRVRSLLLILDSTFLT